MVLNTLASSGVFSMGVRGQRRVGYSQDSHTSDREMHRDRKHISACQEVGEWIWGHGCFMGTGVLVGRSNDLELDNSDGTQHRACS